MPTKRRKLVAGTVRYKVDSRYVYASPSTYRYSTALMIAQEYFDGRKWVPYIPGLNNLTTKEERERDDQIRDRKIAHHKRR